MPKESAVHSREFIDNLGRNSSCRTGAGSRTERPVPGLPTRRPEAELNALFPDCQPGAIPALGEPYGLDTVWDSALAVEDEIYFKAGDHGIAVRVSGKQFRQALVNTRQIHCN